MTEPKATRVFETAVGPEVVVDGMPYLWFGGTAYLGLQSHPAVIRAAIEALERYGMHPGSARAGYGTTPPLLASERALAAMFGTAAALHVASGFAATALMLAGLPSRRWRAFCDERAHESVFDAVRARALPFHAFAHRDASALSTSMREHLEIGETPLVLTDGVFAGTGALAPLPAYRAVLADHAEAVLAVDDAHGIGVLGARGRGTAEHFGLPIDQDRTESRACRVLIAGTASKALGGHGGILVGARETIERARAHSPWHAGSTPPTNPVAAATAAAVELARDGDGLRARLGRNLAQLERGLAELGVAPEPSPAPILAIACRDRAEGERRHAALRGDGILVPLLRDYGGLSGAALRIAVFATHRDEHLKRLLDALRRHL